MKTTLLLDDEATRPTQLLQDAAAGKVPFRDTEAVAGCNCARWGHPCPGRVEPVIQPKTDIPISAPGKQTSYHMDYLIVLSVTAMMTLYVLVIARCLRCA